MEPGQLKWSWTRPDPDAIDGWPWLTRWLACIVFSSITFHININNNYARRTLDTLKLIEIHSSIAVNDLLDDELAQFRMNLQLYRNTEPRPGVEASLWYIDENVAVFLEFTVRENTVSETEGAQELTDWFVCWSTVTVAVHRTWVGCWLSITTRPAGVRLSHVEVDLYSVWSLWVPPRCRQGDTSQTDDTAHCQWAGRWTQSSLSVTVNEMSFGAERRFDACCWRRWRLTTVTCRRRQSGVK